MGAVITEIKKVNKESSPRKRKIGYARVSTLEQNLDRQIKQLNDEGCEQIYEEKKSGKNTNQREVFLQMLSELQEGDELIVTELTRLSRSTSELIQTVAELEEKGVKVKSLKESWLDTTTAHGRLLMTIFSGLSQFERELLAERTKEGIEVARSKGVNIGRPQRKMSPKYKHAVELYQTGNYTSFEICDIVGISRSTLYRILREGNVVSCNCTSIEECEKKGCGRMPAQIPSPMHKLAHEEAEKLMGKPNETKEEKEAERIAEEGEAKDDEALKELGHKIADKKTKPKSNSVYTNSQLQNKNKGLAQNETIHLDH